MTRRTWTALSVLGVISVAALGPAAPASAAAGDWVSIGHPPATCGQGPCVLQPAAADWGPGHAQILALGAGDGQLYHFATDNPAAGWDQLSPLPDGRRYVGVGVTSIGAGAITMTATDNRGGIWHRTYLGASKPYRAGGWYAWKAVNPPTPYGRSYGQPSMVIENGRQHLVLNWNGISYHCLYTQSAPGRPFMCAWTSLGTLPNYGYDAPVIDENLTIWQFNGDGRLYTRKHHAYFPDEWPNSATEGWDDWSGNSVPPGGFPSATPAIDSDDDGRSVIVVNSHTDHHIHLRGFGTQTMNWWNHTLVVPGDGPWGDPAITVNRVGNVDRVDIFVSTSDGGIYQETVNIA